MGQLAPAIDDPLRGKYLYWMLYTPGVIEPCMAEKVSGWEVKPGCLMAGVILTA